MADAPTARWHGDNYQARVFWENALNLLHPDTCVAEVCFEADGPKAFDDVVVRYDPAIARSQAEKVPADYQQVKWHVGTGGRFGYADFIDPAFIGAKQNSLLQRLQQARRSAPDGSHFSFLTTYRIKDDDPLATMISGVDKTLMLDRLFDGTLTDGSKMGQVRKLWREHLGLTSNDELRNILTGFRLLENSRSLEEMRTEINFRAHAVGLLTCTASDSDFRYDELARQLKIRGLNSLTRDTLLKLCGEHGLLVPKSSAAADEALPIAIRSFWGPAADMVGASPDNTLLLTVEFNQRYLQDGREWQRDIRPRVEAFLGSAVRRSARLRLILDAHASIAFLAGAVLDLKAGADVSLVQKGRVGTKVWRADDGIDSGTRFTSAEEVIGTGTHLAIALSVTHPSASQARGYCQKHLPDVGRLVNFTLPTGPGQQAIEGGRHAAALAEQVSNQIRDLKVSDPDATVHLFAACPNSLLFFIGQGHRAIAPCIVYEFDFDRKGNKTYQPSFVID